MTGSIGIDLGGHTISGALVQNGAIVRRHEIATPACRGVESVIDAIASLVRTLSETPGTPAGIGIPGMLDKEREHILRGPNFPGWDDVPLRTRLAAAIDAPVRLENDANCYAVGEGVAGAAKGMTDYVVFTLGSGIGGGVICDGRLLLGGHGMGAELGHICVGTDFPCGCDGRGHLETVSAADGIEKAGRAAGLSPHAKDLWALRKQDDRARDIWNRALRFLATGITSVVHTFDPQAVILGGGMSRAEGLLDELRPLVLPMLSKPFRELLDLRISTLGNDAAVIGAASLVTE